ncbi:MAG: inositol monophosphatase [Beijerinckiaceae bacterium]|nr:inositol monophosphatase [Beijerinckiaceae bacterium]
MIRTPLMNVMTAAVLKAGRGLKRDFGEVSMLQVQRKGPGDFVSLADKRAEQVLYDELSRVRPGYGFVMEESGVIAGADSTHTWHVDPLDGTTNFLHGIPQFAVSVGLERNGEMVAGVIYNPANDELYMAEKGQGAYLNNQRLRVSGRVDLHDAVIGCGIPTLSKGGHQRFMAELGALMPKCSGIRRAGAAALDLAFVAAGRLDAYWERGIHSWDMAAGIVLVREAGGFVTDAKGGEEFIASGEIVAGNEAIQADVLKLVKSA